MRAALPANEEARLDALRKYRLLDTADELAYDDLVVLAASICKTPMACISLIDEDRQWFKARIGLSFRDTDRDLSFCAHTILRPDHVLIVPDARHDPRFGDNDLVIGSPNIKFYCGVALINPDGLPIGGLAVMDKTSRSISVDQVEMLRALARQVVAQFELRRSLIALREQAETILSVRQDASVAEKTKKTFLSNISHEFRTPINGIMGMSTLLASTPLSDRQFHYVETIEKSAEGLLNVLSNILEYSKNETGNAALSLTSVDLFGLMDEISALMRPTAIAKQVRFDTYVDEKLRIDLMGDLLKIQQVLANLVGNALKFTARGFVEISVFHIAENQHSAIVRFEVKDTGIGIAREMQSKIFNEFTQVEQGSERAFGGSGLGLTICRQLARQMGAEIKVNSELGVGSTFWFDLVMPFMGMDAQPVMAAVDSNLEHVPNARVLVVEDNEVNAMVLAAMLEKNGCDVTCVALGGEAIQAMEKEPFDLVFMDVQMPDMDGMQATRAIRRLPFPACTVPVVALTASILKEDEAMCKSAGMNDFISKPISERVIALALSRWLVRSRSSAMT